MYSTKDVGLGPNHLHRPFRHGNTSTDARSVEYCIWPRLDLAVSCKQQIWGPLFLSFFILHSILWAFAKLQNSRAGGIELLSSWPAAAAG